MGSLSKDSNDASLHYLTEYKGKDVEVNKFYILAYLREQISTGVKLSP